MAYVTGSAADMAAVKTALVNACTANGWTEQTDAGGKTVLSNGGCYVRVEVEVDYYGNDSLDLLGRTSLDSGDMPDIVSMATLGGSDVPQEPIQFPVTYHAFIFASEVFFLINYSDTYQWCAFGQSQQAGLPGTGNWVGATMQSNKNEYASTENGITITSSGGVSRSRTTAAALFWQDLSDGYLNCWLHNNFEASYPWALGNGSDTADPVGIAYLTELINAQPNQFSGEGVFLPIRAYKKRLDSKVSQILEIEYARHIRIDNYTNEQVITLGTDEWMVFPFYKRDETNRNGGTTILHTGTFGWAIKKA